VVSLHIFLGGAS